MKIGFQEQACYRSSKLKPKVSLTVSIGQFICKKVSAVPHLFLLYIAITGQPSYKVDTRV